MSDIFPGVRIDANGEMQNIDFEMSEEYRVSLYRIKAFLLSRKIRIHSGIH